MDELSITLFETLGKHFSEQELKTLCFYLDIDYDDLPGEGREDKARELVKCIKRHGRVHEFVEIGQKRRPDISWNEALDVMEANNANLERQRDLETLRKIFESINITKLDNFFYTTQTLDWFDGEIFFFAIEFVKLMRSSDFHIYDKTLAEKVDKFSASWQDTLNFDEFFEPMPNNNSYRFIAVYKGEAAYSRYHKATESAKSTFIDLIKYVKENYIELDIDQTNKLSSSSYKAYLAYIDAFGKN